MTDKTDSEPPNSHVLQVVIQLLEESFPGLSTVPLHEDILHSPKLAQLGRLTRLSIPIDAYAPDLIELYQQITSIYYQHMFRIHGDEEVECKEETVLQVEISDENHQLLEIAENVSEVGSKIRGRINYLDMAKFIEQFSKEQERQVSEELIEMGKVFSSWKVKEVEGLHQMNRSKYQRVEYKSKTSDIIFKSEKEVKVDKQDKKNEVQIILGKSINQQTQEMRHEIINRAKNNKILEQNTRLTQLEKIGIQITYILNRLTGQYFDDFSKQLKPYAKDEIYSIVLSDKILEKILEEHNFISIYCKLVKKLKGVSVVIGGDKTLKFKAVFIDRLQENFYNLIRKGEWENKEETYKKQLIGMSSFVGQLLQMRFLSKFIYCDCFYELVRTYVLQYHQHKYNKSIFFYETYIECAIKIIQKMDTYFDELLKKRTTDDIAAVAHKLIDAVNIQNGNFQDICDYVKVLSYLNQKLPSNRFKITFLLEDFKCSKHLRRQKQMLNNQEFQIISNVLSIDIDNKQSVKKVPGMLAKGNSETLMKDFLFQFAQGTIKQVTKNIQIFKIMAESKSICQATLSVFKRDVEGLFLIETDYPFMCQGLAKIMKVLCDNLELSYQELKLGEYDHEDEDIRWFLQRIEGKYYKLIMQD